MSSEVNPKTFSFNAGSFKLKATVEGYLKEQNAISSDFGTVVYIDAERAGTLLGELFAFHSQGEARNGAVESIAREYENKIQELTEAKRISEAERVSLAHRLKLANDELASLSKVLDENSGSIQNLKDEITKIKLEPKPKPAESNLVGAQSGSQAHLDRSRNELQTLRTQHAEAIATVKVLEAENAQLYKELESLRKQNPLPQKSVA